MTQPTEDKKAPLYDKKCSDCVESMPFVFGTCICGDDGSDHYGHIILGAHPACHLYRPLDKEIK